MTTSPFDLHWNLTTPEVGADDNAKTYPMSALPTLDNAYFHITDAYVQFWAPVAGQPTAKSVKTRSELREYLPDGSGERNWLGSGGNHSLGASLVIDDVPNSPANKGSVFVGQIHADGGDSPLFKFKFQTDGTTGRMIASFRADPDGDAADSVLLAGIAAGARIQYYAKVNSAGLLSAYVEVDSVRRTFSGDLKLWLQKRPTQQFYFKAGVYNNAQPGTSTGSDDGSKARFYKLSTSHV